MKSYYERVQDEIDGICPTKGKLQTKKMEKQMNELQVTIIPAQISANLAEIKAELLENLKQYDIEVTIETLPEAKKMATDLNKLADVVIRLLDICGYLNIDLEAAIIEKMRFNESRPYRHGGKKL